MTERASQRQSLRRPLPLAHHPLYRFYEGGALTRQFRGLPERPDDWWAEDWWDRAPARATRTRTAASRA
jgi:hypothetical protein